MSNGIAIIAKSIRDATSHGFKLLLTATPLQNSLLELYGLVSFVDDLTFGDLESFKFQFSWAKDEESFAYDDLTSRLKNVCIRTLRKQVLEYIRYTKRTALTQEFYPSNEEQTLYDKVSKYLQKSTLLALPNSQRHLITSKNLNYALKTMKVKRFSLFSTLSMWFLEVM